jgi:hypothetical protein
MSNANRDGSISAADIIAARALSQAWKAAGIVSENYDPVLSTAGTAPTTQKVFGDLFGFSAGQVLTGILTRNVVAAAGTLPTTARFGIADAQGNMLAISGNVNALANWAAGPNLQPFATPYQIPSDGGYYLCFVVNGTWGSTQPTPLRATGGVGAAHGKLAGGSAAVSFEWAGQTDLPAVGSALTLTTGSSIPYYLAAY